MCRPLPTEAMVYHMKLWKFHIEKILQESGQPSFYSRLWERVPSSELGTTSATAPLSHATAIKKKHFRVCDCTLLQRMAVTEKTSE